MRDVFFLSFFCHVFLFLFFTLTPCSPMCFVHSRHNNLTMGVALSCVSVCGLGTISASIAYRPTSFFSTIIPCVFQCSLSGLVSQQGSKWVTVAPMSMWVPPSWALPALYRLREWMAKTLHRFSSHGPTWLQHRHAVCWHRLHCHRVVMLRFTFILIKALGKLVPNTLSMTGRIRT